MNHIQIVSYEFTDEIRRYLVKQTQWNRVKSAAATMYFANNAITL